MQPEVITTVIVGALLAMFSAILAWQGKGRFDALEKEISSVKSEQVQTRAELVSIHATLVQVALAVGSQPRPEAG